MPGRGPRPHFSVNPFGEPDFQASPVSTPSSSSESLTGSSAANPYTLPLRPTRSASQVSTSSNRSDAYLVNSHEHDYVRQQHRSSMGGLSFGFGRRPAPPNLGHINGVFNFSRPSSRGKDRRSDIDSCSGSGSHFSSANSADRDERADACTSPLPADFGVFHGWKAVFLGSWFNLLLVFIPAALILDYVQTKQRYLICIFCILAMVPLVRLHDLATAELAVRIGGSRTGLLNASMSNIVELVVAIIALRKCELRVVQSTLIGSILSKLLLILGICFFAGGMRFTEQLFDSTATQIHSSLLSVSVNAMLIPAAFHFTYNGLRNANPDPDARMDADEQKMDILKMSRGVSIVLLLVYVAYLLFQLWSHTHLYRDTHKPSKLLTEKMYNDSLNGGSAATPQDQPSDLSGVPPTMERTRSNTSAASSSLRTKGEKSRSSSDSYEVSAADLSISAGDPTVRLVTPFPQGESIVPRMEGSWRSDDSTRVAHSATVFVDVVSSPAPQLSWPMTWIVLLSVTVMVGINVEQLVSSMDDISSIVSKEWLALVLLPAVGAIAECITAINVSVKDQLTLSMSLALGSTIQTCLFVIPFVISLGWILGKPLALLFDPFETLVLYLSVTTLNYVVGDGKANWLGGVILFCFYIVIAVSFWFYPGSNFSLTLATCPNAL